MPFVKRDEAGKVVAIINEPESGDAEHLPADSPEIAAFLIANDSSPDPHGALAQSDSAMIRVVEDLIDILVDKHLILMTDLPEAAQGKLLARRQARGQLDSLAGLIRDDQDF